MTENKPFCWWWSRPSPPCTLCRARVNNYSPLEDGIERIKSLFISPSLTLMTRATRTHPPASPGTAIRMQHANASDNTPLRASGSHPPPSRPRHAVCTPLIVAYGGAYLSGAAEAAGRIPRLPPADSGCAHGWIAMVLLVAKVFRKSWLPASAASLFVYPTTPLRTWPRARYVKRSHCCKCILLTFLI